MLAVDWNAVGALSGLFGVVVVLGGATASRLRTRRKRRQDFEAAEGKADAALITRIAVLEKGQNDMQRWFLGVPAGPFQPEVPGFREDFAQLRLQVAELIREVRNGNGHS